MLQAHSLIEAQLFLKITACASCNPKAPGTIAGNKPHQPLGGNVTRLSGTCPSCGRSQEWEFTIPANDNASSKTIPAAINPTGVCSQIIDVGQWLTLSQMFIQEGKSDVDRARSRLSNLQAAQCLDEALKFYDDPENDLPPASAFYTEASRRRFRESPQQFSRTRLISERRKLPMPFSESKPHPNR